MSGERHPNGAVGRVAKLAVSVGKLGSSGFDCPMKLALNARVGLGPELPIPKGKDALEDFTLDPIMQALDRVESRPDLHPPKTNVHKGHARWAEHAVRKYQEAFDSPTPGLPALAPLPGRRWETSWTSSGMLRREITTWGRRYASADRAVCELRMITFRSREEATELRELKAVVAAYVIARAEPNVERIRVVDFACLEGTSEVRFDGSREQASERYNRDGRPAVATLLNGRGYQPGSSCVDCRFIAGCPAMIQAPGLLGLARRNIRRRTWSPSAGRNYQACPARHFLRDRLRLPIDGKLEHNGPAERGRAIHRALTLAHNRTPARRCPAAAEPDWYPSDLPPVEVRLGSRLIEEHAEVCPRLHLPLTADMWSEHQLTFWDAEADVVVITTPDLLYDDDGSVVWREVKTGRTSGSWRGDPVVRVPQIALAVLLLRHGVFGTGPRQRVELEILRPNLPEVISIDPFNDAIHDSARRTIHELVRPWHGDDLFLATPGHCADCVVARWCPSVDTTVRLEA